TTDKAAMRQTLVEFTVDMPDLGGNEDTTYEVVREDLDALQIAESEYEVTIEVTSYGSGGSKFDVYVESQTSSYKGKAEHEVEVGYAETAYTDSTEDLTLERTANGKPDAEREVTLNVGATATSGKDREVTLDTSSNAESSGDREVTIEGVVGGEGGNTRTVTLEDAEKAS